MKKYKISEISKLCNVTSKALRGYEEKGLLEPLRGVDSNYRLYSSEHISVVNNIKYLQNLGFSLKEVKLILKSDHSDLIHLKSVFENHLSKTSLEIDNLKERKLVISNIIKKLNSSEAASSELTAKERDVFMGVTTGFSKLDQLLDGDNDGQLIFVAARPGMGKTSLTVHIAYNLIEQRNMAISIYSTEFDHDEWLERLAIQKTKIDRYKKDFTSEEVKQLKDAREEISQKTVYYRHDNFISIDEIVEKSIEINKSLGAVVVDYYQDIQGNAHEKCLKLKELSRKLSCPILVLSTVLESADKREGKRPIPEDLKDYGAIKDNFDKLIIVSQDPNMSLSKSKKIANLDIYSHTKNSHNHIHLVWDGSYCGYSESL